MSAPEAESAEAADAESAAADAESVAADAENVTAAAPPKDPWNDPRLPWLGKPRTADILCWAGIVLSGLFYWALLPFSTSAITGWVPISDTRNGSSAQ